VSAVRFTEVVEALVAEMGLEHIVLVGNSIGGAVSISYAAAHPEKVRALVLANSGGLDPGATSMLGKLYMGNLIRHFEQGERNEARFEAWYRDYYADLLITPEAASRRTAIVAAGYEHAPLLVQAWHSFSQPEADLTGLVPQVTAPVLIAFAKKDRTVVWERNRAALERFPHAKVVFFDAGHAAFLETPEPFNAALSTFLGELP
jgi:pimeloyl-ACP methyl ester carboxylesterase